MAGMIDGDIPVFDFPSCLPLSSWKHSPTSDGIRFFCINLNGVEHENAKESKGLVYQCQMMLYNVPHQQFIGNHWSGKAITVESNLLPVDERLYFYTTLSVRDLLLCIYLKQVLDSQEKIVGWTAMNLIDVGENHTESQTPMQYRVSLLSGSPLSLFYMTGNLLETLNKTENATSLYLKFSLWTHPLLMRLMHLIPENYLLSPAKSVPGLLQMKKDYGSGPDVLKRPQLQKCQSLVLSDIMIRFSPSLKSFEDELLKNMTEENEIVDSSSVFGDTCIVQRQLQVGIHNGLCFLQDSDSYRLLVEPVITTQVVGNKHSSTSSTSSYTREESLVVRSDVKIPNVPIDPNVFIIFVVEYNLSMQNQSSNAVSGSSLGRNQSSSVSLLWGTCSLSTLKQKAPLTMKLTNNPSKFPNKMLFLRTLPESMFTLSCSIQSSEKALLPRKRNTRLMKNSRDGRSNDDLVVSSVPDGLHQLTASSLTSSHRSISHGILQVSRSEPMTQPAPIKYSSYQQDSENEAMEEVDVIPSSLPLVPPTVQIFPGEPHLPHSAFAKLFTSDFQYIYDQHGQSPTIIDPSMPYSIDIKKELPSVPEGHKFVFLFLGMVGSSTQVPETLYFTFQFYRFPPIRTERITLRVVEGKDVGSSRLHIFQPEKSNSSEPSGYQVAFSIDPSYLNVDEDKIFASTLAKGSVVIDVWDALSHFYFGTFMVPLKYLCRQGRESVCTTLELEIVNMEFPDDSPGPRISHNNEVKGHIHMRLVSIRTALNTKSLSKLKDRNLSSSMHKKMDNLNDTFSGGKVVLKANPIIETNKEVARLLASRNSGSAIQDSHLVTEERRRKLARMDALRRKMGSVIDPISLTKDMQNFFNERQRDLLVIESYVERNKTQIIQSLLHSSVTSVKHLNVVLGECCYFEFELCNPLESDQNVYISASCQQLSLVISDDEWNFFRNRVGINVKTEKSLISNPSEGCFCIFLKARETARIPFKYQISSYTTFSSMSSLKASSGHCLSNDIFNIVYDTAQTDIKVSFQIAEGSPIAALVLKVQVLPPGNICQSLRFLAPESSVFQKSLVIKNLKHVPELLSSDPNFTCEIIPMELRQTTISDITFLLKGPTGNLGKTHSFYLFIYEDKYLYHPSQTWKISIQPLNRVDLSCIAGQAMRSSLILRGEHCSSMVRCYSDALELTLFPLDAFVLAPFSVHELAVTIRCLLPGIGYFRINMVDQSLEEVLQSWILVVSSQKPNITKAFQVHLTLAKEAIKRIFVQNLFSTAKQYIVSCSHPHLLHVKETRFYVDSKTKHSLILYFPPQITVFSQTLFLYITDESGRNEATYCIKLTCQ